MGGCGGCCWSRRSIAGLGPQQLRDDHNPHPSRKTIRDRTPSARRSPPDTPPGLSGNATIAELKENRALARTARRALLSEAELIDTLVEDPSAFIDDHGNFAYVEAYTHTDSDIEQAIIDTADTAVPTVDFATTDTGLPLLSSRSDIGRKIYLDLHGHTTTSTPWNTSYTSGEPIMSAPSDLDGSPTTFNDAEAPASPRSGSKSARQRPLPRRRHHRRPHNQRPHLFRRQ